MEVASGPKGASPASGCTGG